MPIRKPVIGYLLKTYPKLSETFILNEILELERQGVDLQLLSLRTPKDAKIHPDVNRVTAPVTYIPSLLPTFHWSGFWQLLRIHWQLRRRDPQRYRQAWKFFQSRPEAKRLNEFLQAGYLAWVLQQLEIQHLQVHFINVPTATVEIARHFYEFSFTIFAHAKDIYLTAPDVLDRRIAASDRVLTCTQFNQQYLQRLSTSQTPIHLCYHGINFDRFQSSGLPPSSDRPLILSVGRLCEKKGFLDLIQACYHLRQAGYAFRCEIVGYGDLQSQLQELIQQLSLEETVRLIGKLHQDELVQRYQQASLFVLPCQVLASGDRDGIPNVLLEAMAMGIPVVSTAISGISELVRTNYNGILVPERRIQDLVAAIETLLLDSDLRQRLGQAGRDTVRQQFALDRNVSLIRNLLLPDWPRVDGSRNSIATAAPTQSPLEVITP